MSNSSNDEAICAALEEFWLVRKRIHHEVYIFGFTINVMLCVPTVIANSLLLTAIIRTPAIHNPANVLVGALSMTDLGVGLLAQPLYVSELFSRYKEVSTELWCAIQRSVRFTGVFLSFMSFMTFTTISIDKLLMLKLHLRYRVLVTTRHILVVLLCQCVTAFVAPLLQFYIMAAYNFMILVSVSICSAVTLACFIKIHVTVRKHRREISCQRRAISRKQEAFNRAFTVSHQRTTVSLLAVYAVFLTCYLPYACNLFALIITGTRTPLLDEIDICTSALIFLNSLLNPILLYRRMPDIRNAVKKLLQDIREFNSRAVLQESSIQIKDIHRNSFDNK